MQESSARKNRIRYIIQQNSVQAVQQLIPSYLSADFDGHKNLAIAIPLTITYAVH